MLGGHTSKTSAKFDRFNSLSTVSAYIGLIQAEINIGVCIWQTPSPLWCGRPLWMTSYLNLLCHPFKLFIICSVLDLVVVKKGEQEIPGLTDSTQPRRLGPKRVGKIRKLFNLSREDDVRQYVVHRPLPEKEGRKPKTKAPKIQRLVTPARIQVF